MTDDFWEQENMVTPGRASCRQASKLSLDGRQRLFKMFCLECMEID